MAWNDGFEKKMISFIIPTIYKSPRLIKLLYDLESCNLVSEVLLIEDAPYTGMLDGVTLTKTTIIPFTEKRYCNGAWNFGIENVSSYYYALCNDDINFDTNIIDDVLHFYKLRPNSGFIGMDASQYDTINNPEVFGFVRHKSYEAVNGWGCLIFNHKSNNVIIPNDLKHWCGDSYYLTYSKYPCYNYFGSKVYTEMSTSMSPEIMEIGIQDQKAFESKYKK